MKKPKNAETAREEDAGKPATDPGWADIDPMFLAGNRSPAPAFPLAALPDRFRDMVSGIATARQVNLDLVTASALAITAGAVGNRVRLEITERRTEPATLFVGLVAEPGDGKTEAIDIAREAFNAIRASPATVERSDQMLAKVEHLRNLDARSKR